MSVLSTNLVIASSEIIVKQMHMYENFENESCEITTCNLRHTKPSGYFRDLRRCKFIDCKLKHILQEIENDAIKNLKNEN